ncbi:MAG: T9SS type A sorting domain-containing protein [Ignavibacteria bacterium]|nr:T9SS type A sorting domain-containing protein [Ignavibacteria bacterium]
MKTLSYIIIFVLSFVLINNSFSQPYYYNSGDPTNVSNWGNLPGGTGTNPPDFAQSTDYIIEGGKSASVNSNWTIFNGGVTKLVINTDATLINNSNIFFSGFVIFQLDSNATYNHNTTVTAHSSVFAGIEFFKPHSNVIINNWSSTFNSLFTGLTYTSGTHIFGNLEINWTGNSGEWYQNLNTSFTMCANTLKITSTGDGILIWNANGSSSSSVFRVTDYIQTGGEVDFSLGSTIVGGYASSMVVTGNFNKSGGIIDASATSAFGLISFSRGVIFGPFDTVYQNISNSGTLRKVRLFVSQYTKLNLQSNIPLTTNSSLCGLYLDNLSKLFCGTYQITGVGPIQALSQVKIRLESPNGFKHGASGGNIITTGTKTFQTTDTLEFAGSTAQITGDSLPFIAPCIITINNSNGVTLSRNHRASSTLRLLNGSLNLGNFDLTIPNSGIILNFNQDRFINTNGTGSLRMPTGFTTYTLPIGYNTYAPLRILHNGFDTLSYRVSDLIPSALPRDTSYAVKKVWHVIEQTPGGSTAYLQPMWLMTDVGSNFNAFDRGAVAKYNSSTLSYEPKSGSFTFPFLPPPYPQALAFGSYSFPSTPFNSFNANDYYMAGNEIAFYERYFYNSGDAGLLSSWKENEDGSGSSPSTFDSYILFNIGQNKIAEFNTPVTFGANTFFRPRGNSQFTSNQPITVLGNLEFLDSTTYNHNNNAIAANTIWAGNETFSDQSTYNVQMWSDTTHKIKDGVPSTFGNLILDFDNLTPPIGVGSWAYHNFVTSALTNGDLWLKRTSGFQFAPVGFYYTERILVIGGDLKIGDSLNIPSRTPVLNLSAGSFKSPDSSAGTLFINGNVDIQLGGIISQDFPVIAKGRLAFQNNSKHTFYSHKPFQWGMYNLGNANYPNIIYEGDTLVLKSDFYNSSQPPFLFQDMWEVRGVLDADQYAIRSTNLRVPSGGKVITRSPNGFDIQLSNAQTVDFQPGSSLEFAGNVQQQFMSTGIFSDEIKNHRVLIINNPEGVVMNIDSVTVLDTLKLLSGKLITNSTNYITTLPSTGVQYQFGSYIDGPLRAIINNNFPNPFPVGKGDKSRIVSIWQVANLEAEYMIEYFDTVQTYGDSLEAGLTLISPLEHFVINKSSSFTFNTAVGLGWGQNSGITDLTGLRVCRWNGTFWKNEGNIASQGSNDSGLIFSNSIDSFSPFVIGTTDSQPLPVELSSFTSSVDRNNVTLNWSTTIEVNNAGFDIERKAITDTVWNKISHVQGYGNSNQIKNYTYRDINIPNGKYNYRLKQIDYNGNFVYYNLSSEINVGIPEKFELSQNYPNPFNPVTKINFDLPKESKVTLSVFDITGRLVASLLSNQNFSAGYHTVQFNGSNFASGTYFYRLTTGDFTQTKKMQLVK